MNWILWEDPETPQRLWPRMAKHTNEEAQVYVHDLDLFVTVQILEETPAVRSLGKLCSEHGYSYEWKNGEAARLTKHGNIITCTMDNFVPLVVPGLSSSPSSSTISTSRTKGQSSSSGESEKPSDPVTARSDKPTCGRSMQTDPEKRASGNRGSANKDEMDKEDPTQGIPDWLQPFTDNLEDLETHVPAHSSERENSESEGGAAKVVTNRKHSIYTHFPTDRNRDVYLRTKLRGFLAENVM